MNKCILLLLCIIIYNNINVFSQGWNNLRGDLVGSNYNSFGSSFRGTKPTSLKWSAILPFSDEIPSKFQYSYILLTGDVNGDDSLELVTFKRETLYVFNSSGQCLTKKHVGVSGQNTFQSGLLGDVNSDGKLEIGIGYTREYLLTWGNYKSRIYDGSGSLLNELTMNINNDKAMWPMIIQGGKVLTRHNTYHGVYQGIARWNPLNNGMQWEYEGAVASWNWHLPLQSIADINSDGLYEFTFQSNWRSNTEVINENGNVLLSKPYNFGSPEGLLTNVFIKFSTGQPYRIVGFLNTYWLGQTEQSYLHISDLNGNILFTKPGLSNALWYPAWADIDNDGNQEIICNNGNDSTNILYLLDDRLAVKDSVSIPLTSQLRAVCDVDGDGLPDILTAPQAWSSDSTSAWDLDSTVIYCYDHHLNLKWRLEGPADGTIWNLIVSDIDKNGRVDIIAVTFKRILDWECFVPSLNGIVFNDIDRNGFFDGSDSTLSGWKIFLKNSSGIIIDSVQTDSTGKYELFCPAPGTYTVTEVQEVGWIQTLPTGLGSYTMTISDTETVTGKDFGNTRSYLYIGPSTGKWSDSMNWTGGIPPSSDKFVSIPTGVVVTVDSLPQDTVTAIRVEGGGTLQFSPKVGKLNVLRTLQMDNSSTLQFPETSDTTGVICYRDWINRGTLDQGHSIITFAGNQPKVIASDGGDNTFYKIEITGDSTSVIGNVTVKDQLILSKDIITHDQDSIIIQNSDTNAISGTGIVTQGTITRAIKSGETGTYRFESPGTYIKFSGEGTNPCTVSMTVLSNSMAGNFYWDSLGGRIDTLKNTIVVDSVRKFSKWPFGIPRPRTVQSRADSLYCKIEPLNRMYVIHPECGENYSAQVSLRYDPSELSGQIHAARGLSSISLSESDLKLFRGPYFADSVQANWNMLSLPLSPDSVNKDSLFPTSTTSAFAYDGTYIERTNLNFGEGYWLKFPSAQQVIIFGDDRDSVEISVNEGWNMIGSISYPISASSATSIPAGIITSNFFGYATSYEMRDTLESMHSYWVKTNAPGMLVFSYNTNNSFSKGLSARASLQELNTLTIVDTKLNEGRLYFGSGGSFDVNRYILPPLPPEGMYDVRYTTGNMVALREDVKDGDMPIQISSASYPITIRLDIKDVTQTALLVVDGQVISLSKTVITEITNPKSEIKLRFAPVSSLEIPKEFVLHQNYPNPFNPITTIRYQLPVDCRVTMKVYNILGQVICVLIDEVQSAGFKSTTWIAKDVVSGVYFYQIEATSTTYPLQIFKKVKKVILLK